MRLHRALPAAGITLAAVAFAATITHTLSADFSGAQSTATNISSAGDQLALTSLTHTASNRSGTANWYRSATDFTTAEFQLELEKDDATVFSLADVCLDATATTLSDTATTERPSSGLT